MLAERTFCVLFLLIVLVVSSADGLSCYNCTNCLDIATCDCRNLVDMPVDRYYCTLTRESVGSSYNLYIKPAFRNETLFYVYDPFYISVEESLIYQQSNRSWITQSNKITYGCQKDQCNRAELLKDFPERGLGLTLPSQWLNENLVRPSGQSNSDCHQCPDEQLCTDDPDFIDLGKCAITECSTTCLLTESFTAAESESYCFQSFCQPESVKLDEQLSPQIDINAIYYLRNERFEITEIDIYCQGLDCSKLEFFKDIRAELKFDRSGIQTFIKLNDGRALLPSLFLLLISFLFVSS